MTANKAEMYPWWLLKLCIVFQVKHYSEDNVKYLTHGKCILVILILKHVRTIYYKKHLKKKVKPP